jgi:hypothetical protein
MIKGQQQQQQHTRMSLHSRGKRVPQLLFSTQITLQQKNSITSSPAPLQACLALPNPLAQ